MEDSRNSLIYLITYIALYSQTRAQKIFASAWLYRYVDSRDISDITSRENDSAEVRMECRLSGKITHVEIHPLSKCSGHIIKIYKLLKIQFKKIISFK